MLSKVREAGDGIDIRITSTKETEHEFTLFDGIPYININFSRNDEYEGVSCISSRGKSNLEQRDSSLDEILFHELGHALH